MQLSDNTEQLIPTKEQQQKLSNEERALLQEQIRQKMHIKYQKYYKQWRDFEMLTMILAIVGVTLAIVEVLKIT